MRRLAVILWAVAALLPAATHAASSAAEPAIELPPLIVSDTTDHQPWRYVAGAGMEVLSRCDDDTTRAVVERSDRLNQLLAYVLPPDLQFHASAPRLTLLVDASMAPSMSQNLVTRLRAAAAPGSAAVDDGPVPRVQMLPNLQLADVDLMAVFAIVDQDRFAGDDITYAPEHVLQLLAQRTPPLPVWYIAGIMRLYQDVSFGRDDIKVTPFTWVSEPATDELRNDPDAPRRLMPMTDFFAYQPRRDDPRFAAWQAEAGLLVRWSLDPVVPERRTRLWQFVAAAAQRAPTDALCRAYLHVGYSGLRDRLSDYLPVAIRQPLRLDPPGLRQPPRLRVRDATRAEVARIKGEWERLEVHFVQQRQPQFAPQYVALARQTLDTGLSWAPHDAGVLAARGLLESDLDHPKIARPYLEAAVAAGPVRPRVYLELAKFRLADALAAPDHDPLGVGPAQAVLEPLQRALVLAPPLADLYGLTAEVWARSRAVLTPAQWAFLQDGMLRFPSDPQLLAYAAVLKADGGDFATALCWIDRAVAATAPASRGAVQSIRTAIQHAAQQPAGRSPAPP